MRTVATAGCLLLLFNSVCCESSGEQWADSHSDWSDLAMDFGRQEESCPCPARPDSSPAAVEDALAMTYFKKFANLLFQRKRLQFDAASEVYKRSLLFSVLPSQLDELESVRDPRDLDILLTNILDSAEPAPLFNGDFGCSYTHQSQGVLSLITDIAKDVVELAKLSQVKLVAPFLGNKSLFNVSLLPQVQFLLFAASALSLGYFVHKRYGFRFITIAIGGCFMIGYFYTYLECNRKLEVESMLEVLDSHQEPQSYDQMSWFARLQQYVTSESALAKKKEMLKKSSKINLTYCLPDQVFLIYMNDLFVKQLELLLERVTHSISRLTSTLGFPYCYIAPIFLVALVAYLIKLTFKYVISPRAWASGINRTPAPVAPKATTAALESREAAGDCLSGENLKMLLNVITATSSQNQQARPALPAVSGVQELMEPLEAPPPKDQLDASDDSSKSRDSECGEGFTLVDDPENDDRIKT
ncbi:hypothetical protein KR018_011494 [Drosophila ironensis]|nr:hypothetical protein KR018_011494 [Drosophila ironensis]